MKKTFKGILFALMAIISINAFAQEEKSCELYFKDFTIKAGETKTIYLYLQNNFLGRDFQVQVFFAEGITPVVSDPEDPECTEYFVPVGRALKAGTTFTDLYDAGERRLRMLSVNMKAKSVYTAGDAPVAELKVKADDNFNGKAICQVKDIPGWTYL